MSLSAREAIAQFGEEGALRYFTWLSEEYPLDPGPWQSLADVAIILGRPDLAQHFAAQARNVGGAPPKVGNSGPSQTINISNSVVYITAPGQEPLAGAETEYDSGYEREFEPYVSPTQFALVDANEHRHSTLTLWDIAKGVFWVGATLYVLNMALCTRAGSSVSAGSSSPSSAAVNSPSPVPDGSVAGSPAPATAVRATFNPPGISLVVPEGWEPQGKFRALDDRYSLSLNSTRSSASKLLVEVSFKPKAGSPQEIASGFDKAFRAANGNRYELGSITGMSIGGHAVAAWNFTLQKDGATLAKRDMLFKLDDARLVAVLLTGPPSEISSDELALSSLVGSIALATGSATPEASTPTKPTDPSKPKDLTKLSDFELDCLRNEPFARHGYRFQRADLDRHFKSQLWYKPTTTNQDGIWRGLSAEEKQWIEEAKAEQRRRKKK